LKGLDGSIASDDLLASSQATLTRASRRPQETGMNRITRRRFIRSGLSAAAALAAPLTVRSSHAPPVNGVHLAKYLEPVPLPGAGMVVATPTAAQTYAFTQREIRRQLHPHLPPTPVWAYDDGSGLAGQAGSFGMVVVARSGTPVSMQFTNALPPTYPEWLPVDTRLTPLGDQVRLMSHLHGGFDAGGSDGNPAVTPRGFGPGDTQSVLYPNQAPQTPATLLWFHDHALGATRLHVFAGLAAAYVVRDGFDTGEEPNPLGVPGAQYEIPLVIQDRQFNADGTFLYPRSDIEGVTWIGEYFGDVMLVNGKAWPFLEVEPRLYRLRILNGCNSRILDLDIGGATFWQIGAEGGLFDVPVRVDELVLGPGERADVIVDFSRYAGGRLAMKNHRPRQPISSPEPSLEQVMQIRVGTTVTHPGPASVPSSLPGRKADLADPVATRFITLNEVGTDTPQWSLNFNGARFDEPPTETPRVGTVEDWVYINLTGDTHPIHLHLVTFQVIGRTPFDATAYAEAYAGPSGVPGGIDPASFATGPMQPPAPEERGFKDTVKVNPGFFTTIRAKFDLPSGVTAPQRYVHHCHIVEHEDNDMMRPFVVVP
jgi:spore coat protein A, manganese oxidase